MVEVKVLVAQSYLTLRVHGLWPAGLLCLRNAPDKNTGVGCYSLQGIILWLGVDILVWLLTLYLCVPL